MNKLKLQWTRLVLLNHVVRFYHMYYIFNNIACSFAKFGHELNITLICIVL